MGKEGNGGPADKTGVAETDKIGMAWPQQRKRGDGDGGRQIKQEWPGRNSGKRGNGDGGPADKTGVAAIKSGAHLL